MGKHVNDRSPNFHGDDGRFFLVRCFACGGEHGKENWSGAVATGCCAWCGWSPEIVPHERVPDPDEAARRRRDKQLRQVFGG